MSASVRGVSGIILSDPCVKRIYRVSHVLIVILIDLVVQYNKKVIIERRFRADLHLLLVSGYAANVGAEAILGRG